jgi:hypothetical protein
VAPRRLPALVDSPDCLRLRRADHPRRPADDGGSGPGRHTRPARPALCPVERPRPAGRSRRRRLRRPHGAAPDPDRYRPRSRGDPRHPADRRLAGVAQHGAGLCRRGPGGRRKRALRHRRSCLPAGPGRQGPDRRRQRQDQRHRVRGRDGRSGAGGPAVPVADRAHRRGGERGHLSAVGPGARRHPNAGAAAAGPTAWSPAQGPPGASRVCGSC